MKLIASILLFLSLPFSAAVACSVPPQKLTRHHAELIRNSNTIVLARVAGTAGSTINVWGEKQTRARFETIEALKGNPAEEFILDNGFIGDASLEKSDSGDFDGHKNLVFWDKHITRNWNYPDCQMYPHFFEGRTYLIFKDHPHWRAYEEIRSDEDWWLLAVRKILRDETLEAGLSLSIIDRLKLGKSVFIGRVDSCEGPALEVEENLAGEVRKRWRYSVHDDAMYWPVGKCEVGQRMFVIEYDLPPSPLPYYNSSVLPIKGDTIDFRRIVFDSEIELIGPAELSLDDIRQGLKTD